MLLPRIGESFPLPAAHPHAAHDRRIIAVDAHGQHSYDDDVLLPPTVLIECSCGICWTEDLVEVLTYRSTLAG